MEDQRAEHGTAPLAGSLGFLLFVPAVISCLLLGAHYLRAWQPGMVLIFASAPLLLLVRRRFVIVIFSVLLIFGAGVWIETALVTWRLRVIHGQPWLRMAVILAGVAAWSAGSALAFKSGRAQSRFRAGERTWPAAGAFFLTGVLLSAVQLKASPPGLLLERFLPGAGWFEAFWLSVYAAWLTDKALEPGGVKKWRTRAWALFSIVFFAQLALGLAGAEKFLMTGNLHLPVPALIVAGPIYRGHGLFMLILFGATLLLVGPAWCSWLCYIGTWDNTAARAQARPEPLPGWRNHLRAAILVLVIAAAYIMRRLGVSPAAAMWTAAGFGLIGVGVMIMWSRRTGAMAHCTAFCPIGFVSTRLGKISPFRLRIDQACTGCRSCTKVCRYDALSSDDLQRGRPGESCTLCGDCVGACAGANIGYRFPGLGPAASRALFLVLVVSLHAVFLGAARI